MRTKLLAGLVLLAAAVLSASAPWPATAKPFVIVNRQNLLGGITDGSVRLPSGPTLSAALLRVRAATAPSLSKGLLVFDVVTRRFVATGLCRLLVLDALSTPLIFDPGTRDFRRLRPTESLHEVLVALGTYAFADDLKAGPCAGSIGPAPPGGGGGGTTPQPVPPVADANGPYQFCELVTPWILDGTGSVNPDEGQSKSGAPGDTIQSYAWDLDKDGQFDDASGAQPDVTAFLAGLGAGDHPIQLEVTDTTASSFPGSGQPDLKDTDTAVASVRDAADLACLCITDLAARAKSGKVQLTWTFTDAAQYHVYRGTTAGGPYAFVAATTSTYSTYLDEGLVNGTTYYYVVREASPTGEELCQSNEASATPSARTRR